MEHREVTAGGLLDLNDVRCLETNHGEDLSTQEHECLNGLEGLMAERELLELDESDELDELGIVGARKLAYAGR